MVTPVILGACASPNEPIASTLGKGLKKPNCRHDPIEVLRRMPVFPWLGKPGKVEKMRGTYVSNQLRCDPFGQKIAGMTLAICRERLWPFDRVEIEAGQMYLETAGNELPGQMSP